MDPAKRRKLLSDLTARRGLTRTAFADVLLRLHVEGLLTQPLVPTVSHGQLRREIQRSVEFCGTETRTAYGPLVQTLDMDIGETPYTWPFINPLAFLAHACSVSSAFFELLAATVARAGGRAGN